MITHDNEIAAQAKRVIQIRDGKIESDSGQIDQVGVRSTKQSVGSKDGDLAPDILTI